MKVIFLSHLLPCTASVCVHSKNKEVLRGTNKKKKKQFWSTRQYLEIRTCACMLLLLYYIILYLHIFFLYLRLYVCFVFFVCMCFFLLLFIFITLCVYTYDHLSSSVRKLFNGYSSSLSMRFSNNTTAIWCSDNII